MLTSLAIHIMPMTVTFHIRWVTIPEQSGLPKELQQFTTLSIEQTWSEYVYNMFELPVLVYLCWSFVYSMINFIFAAERIRVRNYDNLYYYFQSLPQVQAFFKKYNLTLSPKGFMVSHFIMFVVLHLVAIVEYHCYWINLLIIMFYALRCVWNGACFYMEYFCKKYEKQLAELEMLQKETEKKD